MVCSVPHRYKVRLIGSDERTLRALAHSRVPLTVTLFGEKESTAPTRLIVDGAESGKSDVSNGKSPPRARLWAKAKAAKHGDDPLIKFTVHCYCYSTKKLTELKRIRIWTEESVPCGFEIMRIEVILSANSWVFPVQKMFDGGRFSLEIETDDNISSAYWKSLLKDAKSQAVRAEVHNSYLGSTQIR